MNSLIYYGSPISPWGHLMANRLDEWLTGSDIPYEIKIVKLPELFALNGNPPVNKRSAAKLNYRLQELRRWKKMLGYTNMKEAPKFFPFDMSLASKVVIVSPLKEQFRVLRLLSQACWELDMDMANPEQIAEVLESNGYDAQHILLKAREDKAEEIYSAHTQDAIDHLVFGVPTLRIGDQIFWGQDRLDMAKTFWHES